MPRPSSATSTPPSSRIRTSTLDAYPAIASSTALSTTSQTRWCRPRSPVDPMYMPGRLRTASKPSSTVMALAPYSFFFELFAAGAVFLAAGTIASISSGVAAAVVVPPASHSTSLPGTGHRTDSEGAFLHTYLRRLWNFSIRGASRRLGSMLAAFWRLSANWFRRRSAVCVARSAPGDVVSALAPRRRHRTDDFQRGHHAVADCCRDFSQKLRLNHPQLGGPRRRFGGNAQHSVAQRCGGRVSGDLLADHGLPLSQYGALGHPPGPAPRPRQILRRRGERLRIPHIGPRPRPRAPTTCDASGGRRGAAASDVLALAAGRAAGLLQCAAHQVHAR